VTVNDRSVAEALALSAEVGRGPPPARPRPPGSSGGGAEAVVPGMGCEAEPCQHGGVCFTDAFSARGFSCRCADGYFGDLCEYGRYTVARCVYAYYRLSSL